ncbi:MAG: hypothetical protein AAFY22_15120, partial [Pseudomonadota bacterium]
MQRTLVTIQSSENRARASTNAPSFLADGALPVAHAAIPKTPTIKSPIRNPDTFISFPLAWFRLSIDVRQTWPNGLPDDAYVARQIVCLDFQLQLFIGRKYSVSQLVFLLR